MIDILKALKWREWVYAALSVACIVLQVWLDLTMPDYMSSITQQAVSGAGGNMGAIWRDGGLMLALRAGQRAQFGRGRLLCRADRGGALLSPARAGL